MRQKSRQKKRLAEILNKYRTKPLNQVQEAACGQAHAKAALLGTDAAASTHPTSAQDVSESPGERITKMLDKYRTKPLQEGGGGVGYLPIKTAAEAGEQDDPVTQADVTQDTNMSDEEIEQAAVEESTHREDRKKVTEKQELNRWAELSGVPLLEQEEGYLTPEEVLENIRYTEDEDFALLIDAITEHESRFKKNARAAVRTYEPITDEYLATVSGSRTRKRYERRGYGAQIKRKGQQKHDYDPDSKKTGKEIAAELAAADPNLHASGRYTYTESPEELEERMDNGVDHRAGGAFQIMTFNWKL
jgi:hypothetical protein